MGQPEAEPLLGEEDGNRVRRLSRARWSMYSVQLSTSAAWGVFAAVYSFYLQRIGGYSNAKSASISAFAYTAYSLGQLLLNPLWGALSDKVGRRVVLSIATTGFTLGMLGFTYANGAWWAITAAFLGCMDATSAMVYALAVDVVAAGAGPGDETDPFWVARLVRWILRASTTLRRDASTEPYSLREELAMALTVTQFVMGIGLVLGLCVGFCVEAVGGIVASFYVASGFTVVPAAYVCVYCPVFVQDGVQGSTAALKDLVVGSFRDQRKVLDLLFHDFKEAALCLSLFCAYFTFVGVLQISAYWGEDKLNWHELEVYLLYIAITIGAGLSAVVVPNVRDYRKSLTTASLCTVFGATLLTIGIQGRSTPAALALIFLTGFSGGTQPAIEGLISARVPFQQQGHLQALLYTITVVATLVALQVYLAFYESVSRGAIWPLTAAVAGIAALSSFFGAPPPAPPTVGWTQEEK